MDADTSQTRLPSRQAPAHGGTVEPANRAKIAKDLFQTPFDAPGVRYELRDPFAEVSYRSAKIAEITAKADQLGSNRFVAIDVDGNRATMERVNGEWQRGPTRPAAPERPLDPLPERDEAPDPADAANAKAGSRTGPAPPAVVDPVAAKDLSRLDAQSERAALVTRLEAALVERYLIKRAPVTVGDVTIGRTEYRFRGDSSRVAFTESTFRLATDTNSPSVARSMVDVAEARNWRTLRVSGNEDFRRMVWLEASVRGVKALGYEPNPADLEVLKKEREARLVNRIEQARDAAGDKPAGAGLAEKGSARGSGGGRKAVLSAIEAVLVAKRVPEKQREAVMAAATAKLAQRMRDGQAPKIKVYDKAVPSQRPLVVPTPEIQRSREPSTPAHTR